MSTLRNKSPKISNETVEFICWLMVWYIYKIETLHQQVPFGCSHTQSTFFPSFNYDPSPLG